MPERASEDFDGRITPEVSRCLYVRRVAFGLSYEELAAVLGISWSTLRKWELGLCAQCTAPLRSLLAGYLRGHFDAALLRGPRCLSKRIHNACLDEANQRIRRIANLYQLCGDDPQRLAALQKRLSAAAEAVLKRCLEAMPGD